MDWLVKFPESGIVRLAEADGESIEEKMRKVTSSKEPIDNVAPLIYTDRKEGVLPQYDHRTDRFELAREATDRAHATRYAKVSKADQALIDAQIEYANQQGTGGEA